MLKESRYSVDLGDIYFEEVYPLPPPNTTRVCLDVSSNPIHLDERCCFLCFCPLGAGHW